MTEVEFEARTVLSQGLKYSPRLGRYVTEVESEARTLLSQGLNARTRDLESRGETQSQGLQSQEERPRVRDSRVSDSRVKRSVT